MTTTSSTPPPRPTSFLLRNGVVATIATLLFSVSTLLVWAGSAGASSAVPLDDRARKEVIEAVAGYAERNYLVPELAEGLGKAIRDLENQGAYGGLHDPEALALRLTADLQEVAPDRHLKVLYSARPRPIRQEATEPTAAEEAMQRTRAARQNFGIERAEHLDGNVGYLKLKKFEDPSLAGDTMIAAMRFLSNTDALVIDLRQNGGGHGDMVALLTSFFFDGESIHMVNFYNRGSGKTEQSWTVPFVPGPRYADQPVYVLTSSRTFSAAEQFALVLQELGRAVLVGETTRGGGHFVDIFQIDSHFAVMIPIGTATTALTGSNWEGSGVTPDVSTAAGSALSEAHRLALEKLSSQESEELHREYLEMLVEEMKAQSVSGEAAFVADPGDYLAYVGRYDAPMGQLRIAMEGDELTAQLGSEAAIVLTPTAKDRFAAQAIGASLSFVGEGGDRASSIRVEMGGRVFEAARVD